MEIREYLRRSGSRLLLFVVVPLVAAALAGVLGATRPATHRVHALVEVPTLGNDAPATVDRSVANFRTALRSAPVLESVVAETGVRRADVAGGIASRRIGTTSWVDVSYDTTAADRATPVLDAALSAAMRSHFQVALDRAGQDVQAAQRQVDDVQARLTALEGEVGTPFPGELHRTRANELAQLRVALELGRVTPARTTDVEALAAVVAERETALAGLADVAARHDVLATQRDRALPTLTAATAQVTDLEVRRDASAAAAVAEVSPAREVGRAAFVLRWTGAAAGIALVLCLALVALLEVVRPSGRSESRATRLAA